jgi:hypothetical protein
MPQVTVIDTTKIVQAAREQAKKARLEMFAAFAQLQLDVQSTHQQNWDSVSVRKLEDKIDDFKTACHAYRSAEDGIIKAMSIGSDRMDSSVPSPAELTNKNADAWNDLNVQGLDKLNTSSEAEIEKEIIRVASDVTPPSE